MALVVVGASLAGLRAVESARRTGYRGRIVLLGAEEHLPYARPPLSKAFLDAGGPGRVRPFHSETVLRDELGVELMLGALTIDRPREIMQYRRCIAAQAAWAEAPAFAGAA